MTSVSSNTSAIKSRLCTLVKLLKWQVVKNYSNTHYIHTPSHFSARFQNQIQSRKRIVNGLPILQSTIMITENKPLFFVKFGRTTSCLLTIKKSSNTKLKLNY